MSKQDADQLMAMFNHPQVYARVWAMLYVGYLWGGATSGQGQFHMVLNTHKAFGERGVYLDKQLLCSKCSKDAATGAWCAGMGNGQIWETQCMQIICRYMSSVTLNIHTVHVCDGNNQTGANRPVYCMPC